MSFLYCLKRAQGAMLLLLAQMEQLVLLVCLVVAVEVAAQLLVVHLARAATAASAIA